jgi:predicted peptidase
MRIASLPIVLVLASCATLEPAHEPTPAELPTDATMTTGFLFDSVTVDATELPFAVYVPRDYTPDKEWPVIVFLNGRGECGTDGQKHLAVGLGPAIMFDRAAWPFIVVFPQKPLPGTSWGDHDAYVQAALDKTLAAYAADESRIYLTGLSQGGNGTWAIAGKHPGRFAAIAPICGYGDAASLATGVKDIPVWAFHGEKDDVVPPKSTTDVIAELKQLGADPKVTLYPNANHNSWDQAYRTEKLGEWFLQHSLKK